MAPSVLLIKSFMPGAMLDSGFCEPEVKVGDVAMTTSSTGTLLVKVVTCTVKHKMNSY